MGFVEYDLIDFVGGSAADWKWVWFLASALICDDIVGVFEWNTMWQNGNTQKFGMIIVSPYGGDWSFCRCHTMMKETIQPLKNLNWGQYNPKRYELQPMPCYFSGDFEPFYLYEQEGRVLLLLKVQLDQSICTTW